MKNLFTAEDFSYENWIEPWIKERVAKTANEKLNKLIESWPVISFSEDFFESNEVLKNLVENLQINMDIFCPNLSKRQKKVLLMSNLIIIKLAMFGIGGKTYPKIFKTKKR